MLKKKGEELYNRVASFEARWLGENVRSDIVKLLSGPILLTGEPGGRTLATAAEKKAAGDRFLGGLKQAWEDHQVCMGMLTDVLMYMVCGLDFPETVIWCD